MALILRNGGSQSPDRWLKEPRNNHCTGYIAQEIWNEINKDLSAYYTNIDDPLKDAFAKLNLKCSNHDLVNNIISFIRLFKNGKHNPV